MPANVHAFGVNIANIDEENMLAEIDEALPAQLRRQYAAPEAAIVLGITTPYFQRLRGNGFLPPDLNAVSGGGRWYYATLIRGRAELHKTPPGGKKPRRVVYKLSKVQRATLKELVEKNGKILEITEPTRQNSGGVYVMFPDTGESRSINRRSLAALKELGYLAYAGDWRGIGNLYVPRELSDRQKTVLARPVPNWHG